MKENFSKEGLLVIITGSTGAGKSSVIERIPSVINAERIRSITTRPMRPGEQEGVDYNFLSKDTFNEELNKGTLIESVPYGSVSYAIQKRDAQSVLEGQTRLLTLNMAMIPEIEKRYRKAFEPKIAQAVLDRLFVVLLGTTTLLELRRRVQQRGGLGEFHTRLKQDWDVWKKFPTLFSEVVINREGCLDETVHEVAALIEDKKRELKHS